MCIKLSLFVTSVCIRCVNLKGKFATGLFEISFYARQHIHVYAIARICHASSVRPSVCHTRALCQNGWKHHRNSFTLWQAHHSSFSLPRVVAQIWRLHRQRGRQIQGGSNFRPIRGYISEMVTDRGIHVVTMEDEYKVACALSNSATFDDLEWPRTPVSRSHSLKANISLTVHPIHSRSGSRQGFSGSANRMALFPVR